MVTKAIEAMATAEKAVGALNAGKAKSSTEMVALANETDAIVEASKKTLTAAKDAVTGVSGETEAELKGFLASEVKRLQNQLNPLEHRSTKAGNQSTQFRAIATQKNGAELEKLKVQALKIIFHHQGAKQLQ